MIAEVQPMTVLAAQFALSLASLCLVLGIFARNDRKLRYWLWILAGLLALTTPCVM